MLQLEVEPPFKPSMSQEFLKNHCSKSKCLKVSKVVEGQWWWFFTLFVLNSVCSCSVKKKEKNNNKLLNSAQQPDRKGFSSNEIKNEKKIPLQLNMACFANDSSCFMFVSWVFLLLTFLLPWSSLLLLRLPAETILLSLKTKWKNTLDFITGGLEPVNQSWMFWVFFFCFSLFCRCYYPRKIILIPYINKVYRH